jgi:adenylate cyclase
VAVRIRSALERFADASCQPGDGDDERLRKGIFTLAVTAYTTAGVVWTAVYWVLGERRPALIPLAYSIVAIGGLAAFLRTKRFREFRTLILTLWLLLPFVMHWALGGFTSSSGVFVWACGAPLGALMFAGIRSATGWFASFAALLVLSGLIEPIVSRPSNLPDWAVTGFLALNLFGVTAVSFWLLRYFLGRLEFEQARSERLLLNVLPQAIADRLKRGEGLIADRYEHVTVLFADLVGFTPRAERLPPERVVELLDRLFSTFDRLSDERGLEKIKTVGDAYMVVAGLPDPRPDHAQAAVDMARHQDEHGRQRHVEAGHCGNAFRQHPALAHVPGP